MILGGGFGGLRAARRLEGEPVEVLLVERNNYHAFLPLLYQVAAAELHPQDIAYPLRTLFARSPNVRVFVLASWAWSYLFFERIARLIVPRGREDETGRR